LFRLFDTARTGRRGLKWSRGLGVGLMHAVGLSGCPTAHLEARSVPWSPRNISGRSTPLLTQRGWIEENSHTVSVK